MPNLVPFVDVSEYYHPDIRRYYQFVELKIDSEDFKLFHFEGIQNRIEIHLYLLTDNSENNLSLLKLVEVTFHGVTYYQICKSYSIVTQEGYGETLYNLCFDLHRGNLISDHINTLPGSYNLWKKILRRANVAAIRYDAKNNRKFKLDIDDEFSIWGVPDSFLEIIKNTQWEAVIVEDEYDNRDYDYENDDDFSIDYLSENDKIERTFLSDFIVKALKKRRQIKDRQDILILM